MPRKKLKESLAFLVNVGKVRHHTQNNSELLDKAKFIIKHTIQKKIFLRPDDEVGVILMGSDKRSTIIDLENVHEICNLQIGNWNLIAHVIDLESTNHNCSWMEAIYAVVQYLNIECLDESERKIMMLSDFNEEEEVVNQFQVDDIVKTLKADGISLIAIGERSLDNIDVDSQTASEALLMNVLRKIDGQYFTFEQAMSDARFYKRPSTKPMLWYCKMELGDFLIPIAGISKTPTEVKLPEMLLIGKTSTSDMQDQEIPIKNVAQWTDNNRTVHAKEDIIRGYVYGGKPIPVSDEAKKAMTPKSNEKCYKIHGFTVREKIPMEYWLSDGTYVIVPANGSVSAPFYSLVQAMVDKNVVAIVEKVYRANTEANIVALFPSVDVPNEPMCLIEIGLPFERDYAAIAQRPLKFLMKQLSKEQNDAVDDLLTSLELPDTIYNKYLPGCMPDPGVQHMWDAFSTRALYPDDPLPPIADDVINLLEQPEIVREKCKPITKQIKDLFSLEKKEPRKKRKTSKEKDIEPDNKNVTPTKSVKINNEKEIIKDNDESEKMIPSSDACNFNFDEIDDI